MNVIKSITMSQIKKAPRRFWVTVIGVVISSAMLTAVFVSYYSLYELLKNMSLLNGNYHYSINAFYSDKFERFVTDPVFSTYSFIGNNKVMVLSDGQTVNTVSYFGNLKDTRNIELLSGSMPSQSGEAAIGEKLNKSGYNLGDTLSLTLDGKEKQYKITAVLNDEVKFFSPYDNSAFIYEKPVEGESTTAFCTFAEINENSTVYTQSLLDKLFPQGEQLDEAHSYDGYFNDSLLQYYGVESSKVLYGTTSFFRLMQVICVIAITIVVAASVLMIYNSFSISTAERRKMLGMLSTVGATLWQKKGFVFYEAALVGAIGIPVGILSGFAGIFVTMYFLQDAISKTLESNVSFSAVINIPVIILSALFSALTLMISSYLPSITAGKVSPIEAVRNLGSVKYKARSTKGLIRKIFGFEGKLAEINMKRNYKRYAATLLSLTSAIVLLISALGPVNLIEESYTLSAGGDFYNLKVSAGYKSSSDYVDYANELKDFLPENSKFYEKITFVGSMSAKNSDVFSNLVLKHSEDFYPSGVDIKTQSPILRIIAVQDSEYEKISGESAQNGTGCVVVNTSIYYVDGVKTKIRNHTSLKENDLVLGEISEKPVSFRVAKVMSEDLVYENGNTYLPNAVTILTSKTAAKAIIEQGADNINVNYLYDIPDNDALYTTLDKLNSFNFSKEQSLGITSYDKSKDRVSSMLIIIKVFTLGFVSLIALVSATNIFNTVYTSVLFRKRELAMIKSVGLEQKRVNKMVFLEGALYALKALLLGLPIGLGIYSLEYYVLRDFAMGTSLPVSAMLLAAVGVAAVTMLSTLPAIKVIKDTPITELLRCDTE